MKSQEFDLASGEEELIEGFANKIGVWGGPGGKLVLTNRRLLFTNRRKSAIRAQYELKDVIFVSTASSVTVWTLAFIITIFLRNAIKLTVKGGSAQRFVVSDKQRWIGLINTAREKLAA